MFILAGLDTTSNALSRILTVLSQHPEHQQKLREELLNAQAAKGLSYDDLNRLPILDATIRETLRLYVINAMTVHVLSLTQHHADIHQRPFSSGRKY